MLGSLEPALVLTVSHSLLTVFRVQKHTSKYELGGCFQGLGRISKYAKVRLFKGKIATK